MLRNTGVIAAVLAFCLAVASASAAAQEFQPLWSRTSASKGRAHRARHRLQLPAGQGRRDHETGARRAARALRHRFLPGRAPRDGNDVLVVFVQERPAIAQIDFSGMKEFEPDNVRGQVLRELGMAEGRIFDRSVLDAAEQELKRQYRRAACTPRKCRPR